MGRRRKGEAVSGWIVLDKAPNLGSTQAVGRVRRAFNAQKAGHAGTLDPLASGVLPIALTVAMKYPLVTRAISPRTPPRSPAGTWLSTP